MLFSFKMMSLKSIIISLALLSVVPVYGQERNNNLDFTLNGFGFSFAYSRKFSLYLQPGVRVGYGRTISLSVDRHGHGNFFNLGSRFQVFNRIEPSDHFSVDIGGGIGQQIDLDEDIGYPERFELGEERGIAYGYIQPMAGMKFIKFGFLVSLAHNGELNNFISLPFIQFRLDF